MAVKTIQLGQVWRNDGDGNNFLVTKVYSELFTQYAMLRPASFNAPEADTIRVKVSRGDDGVSLLGRLTRAGRESLDAQALTAARLLAEGAAAKPETLDVAACTANVTPAWSGGPVAHLWAHRERLAPLLDPVAMDAWPRLESMLRAACE